MQWSASVMAIVLRYGVWICRGVERGALAMVGWFMLRAGPERASELLGGARVILDLAVWYMGRAVGDVSVTARIICLSSWYC